MKKNNSVRQSKNPLLWYLLFTLAIPVINQTMRGTEIKDKEHLIVVVAVPLLLIALFSIGRLIFIRLGHFLSSI